MRITISGATTAAVLMHVRNNSVLAKVRSGMPLYEIAGGMGISTAEASDLLEAELKNEKKKKDLADRKQVVDLHLQGKDNAEISEMMNVSVNFILQTIAVHYSRKLMVEKPVSHFHDKEKESNPDGLSTLSALERKKRDEDVAKAYNSGLKVSRVAEMYGLTAPMVYFILRKNGIKLQVIKRVTLNAEVMNMAAALESGKTVKEVAQQFNCNVQTVYTLIRENGMSVRKRLVKDEAILKAFDEGLSTKEIAEKLALSFSKVYTVLNTHGKRVKRKHSAKPEMHFIKMKELYDEGITFREIGETFNIPAANVYSFLRKKGVTGSKNDERRVQWVEMVKLYRNGTSKEAIAERFNKEVGYVINVLQKRGFRFEKSERYAKIKAALESGKSRNEVASEFGVTVQCIYQVVKKSGMPYRTWYDQRNQTIA